MVAAAKLGVSAAFDELCRSHAKRIFRVTYRITKNREDAEDALQDSLLLAFTHIKEFDGRSSFSTWLTRIAFNSALMIVRKRHFALELSIESSTGNIALADVSVHAPDPEASYAQREREELLLHAICSLRPTIRQAVEIQTLQERSMQETADTMKVSVSAAKSRVFQAKAKLRESLTAAMVPSAA